MTKQERIAIGHRLRQQRNKLGLTREQFAELADIGAGYYGQIEVGTSQMSIDTLIKVSRTSRLCWPAAPPGSCGWRSRF